MTQTLELQSLRDYITGQCGILLADDKTEMMEEQISQLMLECGCEDAEAFYELIQSNRRREIRDRITEVLTSRETSWFRDEHPFKILREKILPGLMVEDRSPSRPVRIWSAGCSTGQEPYSIAMTVDQFCQKNVGASPDNFEIHGTDISPSALMLAMAGRYDRIAMEQGLPPEVRQAHFTESSRTWEVDPRIRTRVGFAKSNLWNPDADPGTFDVVFMRYVASDYSEKFREALYQSLTRILNPTGYLILGEGESPHETVHGFEALSHAGGQYYRCTA
jgi:chemotaxis protein methyltransferase CheR